MFHQIRVDCGKEFYLMLGMQDYLKHLRNRNDIPSYRQTESKKVKSISFTSTFVVILLLTPKCQLRLDVLVYLLVINYKSSYGVELLKSSVKIFSL